MGAVTRRRALAAFVGVAVLPLLAACPGQSESEDCDADDLIEGDEDCDDLDGKSKKKPRSKSKSGRR
jgi:hypothetical protein